jgi:Protein-tyrosine phosphatase
VLADDGTERRSAGDSAPGDSAPGDSAPGDSAPGGEWLVSSTEWLNPAGVATLPSGARVRGRRLSDPVTRADFALILSDGPVPAWPYLRIRWPDFGGPADSAAALDALREAHRRAHAGERVEVACRGGVGRTGTALAALAILDGLTPPEAYTWVRSSYHRRAVETIWQRRWLRRVR